MLADAAVPLADVAVRSGFTSLQYMYAVFRRELGCTPRQYAESAQAGEAAPGEPEPLVASGRAAR
jgi:LacI family transcriptional regulator